MPIVDRPNGNTFIPSTGMALPFVQTGFQIRTGFYITNSGNVGIDLCFNRNNDYIAFTFPSGLKESEVSSINIPRGQCKYIEFDYTAYMDIFSGPKGSSGPAYSGRYTTELDIFSQASTNRQTDPNGNIKMFITGTTSGAEPAIPTRFLVKTGLYSGDGVPITELSWQHPSGDYYSTQYKIEHTDNAPEVPEHSNWTGFHTFPIKSKYVSQDVDGEKVTNYVFATPTGVSHTQVGTTRNTGRHDGVSFTFNDSFWYRIRGEYRDVNLGSFNPETGNGGNSLIRATAWVYGSGVSNFNIAAHADVEGGLVSGAGSPTLDDPQLIVCKTGPKQAMKIRFNDFQTDINLKDSFDSELTKRGIVLADYTNNFTGVHFIVPKNFTVGSSSASTGPAIKTGDVINDSSPAETPSILILEEGSTVVGRGGTGGDGGFTSVKVGIENPTIPGGPIISIMDYDADIPSQPSTLGFGGSSAIQISNTTTTNFKIRAHYTSKILGGGGGGGGGDTFFLSHFLDWDKLAEIKNSIGASPEGVIRNVLVKDRSTSDGNTNLLIQSSQSASIKTFKGPTIAVSIVDNEIQINDIAGLHQGGVGGGGQGFGTSPGGKFLHSNVISESAKGSLKKEGELISQERKISPGGAGGAFGEKGGNAIINYGESSDSASFFTINDPKDQEGKNGGDAGLAVDGTTNTNYTSSNFRSKLLTIQPNALPDTVSNLLAWFDANNAGDITENDDSSAENGDEIKQWQARNDNSITLDQATSGNRPIFKTGITEFNGQSVVSFEPSSASDINYLTATGLTGSSKLISTMDGFEIFYMIHPFNLFSVDPENSNFKNFDNLSPYEQGFCQWSSIGEESQNISKFYSKNGELVDNMGVDGQQAVTFRDFTSRSAQPVFQPSAWVYHLSARKVSSILEYQLFNNGKIMHEVKMSGSEFSFIASPIIGASRIGVAGYNNVGFNGYISEIIIYKAKLTADERDIVTGYLLNKYLRTKTVTNTTQIYINSNRLEDTTNFAGFVSFST